MLCLSVKQPWASLILGLVPWEQAAEYFPGRVDFRYPKDVENRTWKPGVPVPFEMLIHASARAEPGYHGVWEHELPRGVILGAVRVARVSGRELGRHSDSPWAVFGQYHWELEAPRVLREPIAWKGRLGLYEVAIGELETDFVWV